MVATMNNLDFLNYFRNMEPMKYYEGDTSSQKAQDMISNKDSKYFAMRKYDGEWCRAIIAEDGVLLQSRSVSKITGTYGDKTELVPHITEELKNKWPAGTVLLGELAFNDFESTSKDVGSILRCLAPKAIERQKTKKLHFFVFDVLAYKYEILLDKPFSQRFVAYPEYADATYFQPALNDSGEKANFMEFADWVWKQGGEGIMIVREDMIYAPGKRTAWQSLKIKKNLDVLNVDVIGFIEPNKDYDGTELEGWQYFVDENDRRVDYREILNMTLIPGLKPVTKPYYFGWKNGVVIRYEGRTVKVTSGLTDQYRELFATKEMAELLEQGKLKAQITGMELTPDSIRHPVFLKIVETK